MNTVVIRGWARFCWFCIIVSVMTSFFFSLMFLTFVLLGLVRPNARSVALHKLATMWARTMFTLMPGWRIRVDGLENIRALEGRPVIVAANHQSNADVPVAYFLPLEFRWLAKASLFNIPVMGNGMRLAGYVPISRGDKRSHADAFRACREALALGRSLWFFPEGTRSPDGSIREFKPGAFRLSIQSGVPVLPIAIRGTRDLNPKGSLMLHSGLVRLRVLPSVPPSEGESEEAFAIRVRSLIVDAMGE